MVDNIFKNSEGYSDPTTGAAISKIFAEEQQLEDKRLEQIKIIVPIIKKIAELAGFEVVGRNVFSDLKTGKKYK